MIEPNTTPTPSFDFAAQEAKRRAIETPTMASVAAERRNDGNWAIDPGDGPCDSDEKRQDKLCTATE